MQFRTGAKCTETARTDMTDCVDARWTLEIENNSSHKHPKFQFTHKLTMNSRHKLNLSYKVKE